MKIINLTKEQIALVDDEDYEKLNAIKWCASKEGCCYYAVHFDYNPIKQKIKMQYYILPKKDGFVIDHIDGNPLNNQKANLRYATVRENHQNRHEKKTSRYVGVSWNKRENKWRAQTRVNGVVKHLGYFNNEFSAFKAFVKANEIIVKEGVKK